MKDIVECLEVLCCDVGAGLDQVAACTTVLKGGGSPRCVCVCQFCGRHLLGCCGGDAGTIGLQPVASGHWRVNKETSPAFWWGFKIVPP